MPVAVRPAAATEEAELVDSGANQAPVHAEPLSADQPLTLLRALADPIRLQLVEALAPGERCVCELTGELALAQSKLSFHLKVLKQAGLITSRQQGRWVYYRLQPERVQRLRHWLTGLTQRCEWPAASCD